MLTHLCHTTRLFITLLFPFFTQHYAACALFHQQLMCDLRKQKALYRFSPFPHLHDPVARELLKTSYSSLRIGMTVTMHAQNDQL